MKLAEAVADELHIMVKGRMVYRASPAVFRAKEETIRTRFSPRDLGGLQQRTHAGWRG
jgi:hypothetical protein